MKNKNQDIVSKLKAENKRLLKEIARLKGGNKANGPTVKVPKEVKSVFDKAQKTVGQYFSNLILCPENGTIEINEQRYVLVRASALSNEFFDSFLKFYADRGEKEAESIAKNMLFDIAHLIGLEDAKNFHKVMKLKDPISKLSAGPVHFAHSGWAFVDILPESKPSPDENYFLKYNHPYSFEADSWMRAGKKTDSPVCVMNAGYSSGWCEASFGMQLTAVEISCRAKGDKNCTFIMAPPHKIDDYLGKEYHKKSRSKTEVPSFLQRKKIEEQLKNSLEEKEILIKEIHHRVKNNLQIVSSLLNIQASMLPDGDTKDKLIESIGRIKSIATIHELLYGKKDFAKISIKDYFEALVAQIVRGYAVDKSIKIDLKVKLKNAEMEIDKALPCGLILNELLSNCMKHAFVNKKKGVVKILLEEKMMDGVLKNKLSVSDNGVGISPKIILEDLESLGLQLIDSLSTQLDGQLQIKSDSGTTFILTF